MVVSGAAISLGGGEHAQGTVLRAALPPPRKVRHPVAESLTTLALRPHLQCPICITTAIVANAPAVAAAAAAAAGAKLASEAAASRSAAAAAPRPEAKGPKAAFPAPAQQVLKAQRREPIAE